MRPLSRILSLVVLCLPVLFANQVQAQFLPIIVTQQVGKINAALNLAAQRKSTLEQTMSGIQQTANELENSHAMHVQQCPAYAGAFCYDWVGKKAARDAALAAANEKFFLEKEGAINAFDYHGHFSITPKYDSTKSKKSVYNGVIWFVNEVLWLKQQLSVSPTVANVDGWLLSAEEALSQLDTLAANLSAENAALRASQLLPLYADVQAEQECFNAFQQSGGCGGGGGGYPY